MRPVFNGLGFAALALIGLAVAATGASAESRLFSVRTTKPGVTIVQATLNQRDLPVAGQTGNATFFRIDNPSGPVPCSNRIRFVASDGSSVDSAVDLCANNWTLTVATSTGQPSPQPGPVATVPAAGQPIAVATDDPNVTITGVYIAAQPVTIVARRDPYVQIFLPRSGSGLQCSQDLGLALSDGRRIARQVDVCRSNSVVVVPLAGSGYAPPPPAFAPPPPVASVPPVQPLPPPVQPPQQPQAPVQPAPPPMQWLFSAPGGTATLAYAVPGGGVGAFRAVCVAHTGSATITIGASSPDVRPGKAVNVALGAGGFRNSYSGIGTPRDESDGLSHPVLSVALSDPLWASLITERSLAIGVGRAPPVVVSLAGSSQQVKQFLAVCAGAPQGGPGFGPPPLGAPPFGSSPMPPDNGVQLVPPVPGMGQGQPPLPPATVDGSVDYACNDGSEMTATFAGATVTVMQYGGPPITLYQVPSPDAARYVGGNAELVGDGENVYWRRGGGGMLTCTPQ